MTQALLKNKRICQLHRLLRKKHPRKSAFMKFRKELLPVADLKFDARRATGSSRDVKQRNAIGNA